MLTKERNDLLTKTGPGTPAGELLRRYWQPVALSSELPSGGAPLPVKIMSEELVLFRDDQGHPGLLDIHCCHRGSDISYGRVEDGGLRCLYHGWLFDRNGKCIEQPAEPADSTFKDKVTQKAYPCQEVGKVIFAYLGPGDAPLMPKFQALNAPPDQLVENRVFVDCNYLQANEGNIDPAHTSYVHRAVDKQKNEEKAATQVLYHFQKHVCPDLEIEETHFGIRIYATRDQGDGTKHLRITNFVMPNFSAIGGPEVSQGFGRGGYTIIWHVPIDDFSNWRYTFTYHCQKGMDTEALFEAIDGQKTPDHHHIRNMTNRYLQDREEMRTATFAGVGPSFAVHDANVIETMGPIQDRTDEHLGVTDMAIAAARRMLFQGIEEMEQGNDPPHVVRDEKDNDYADMIVLTETIDAAKDIKEYCRELAEENIYA